MKLKKDWFFTGLLLGLLLPPVAFVLFCYFSLPGENILDVMTGYYKLNVLTHVISLAVIVNLVVFFLFLNKHYYDSARGVIGATFFFVIVVLILKLL